MRVLLAVLIGGVTPIVATAQTVPAALPENDVVLIVGWSGAEHTVHDNRRWRGSLLVGLRGGHYWTDHLKTELETSWTQPGDSEIYESIVRDGAYTYALSNYRAHDVRFGVVQIYQFGRNEWVHPYVGVGADVVRRHAVIERDRQSRTVFVAGRNIPVDIPAAGERTSDVFAQAVLKTGLKMYVSEKTFFNTELKLGVRHDVDHVVWKFGMGIDF